MQTAAENADHSAAPFGKGSCHRAGNIPHGAGSFLNLIPDFFGNSPVAGQSPADSRLGDSKKISNLYAGNSFLIFWFRHDITLELSLCIRMHIL